VNVDFTGSDPQPLWHQRADHLYQGLCLLCDEMRRRAGHPEQLPPRWRAVHRLLAGQYPECRARRRSALRHVFGHLVPDLVLGALAQALPGRILAEGSGALWNIHMSVRPLAQQRGSEPRS
jgi:N-methylhydantoinase B